MQRELIHILLTPNITKIMKTRIVLILLLAFGLSSCLGRAVCDIQKVVDIVDYSTQEPALVLQSMIFNGGLTLDKDGYKMSPLTKNDLENVWYDEHSYNEAKKLLETYNKDLKSLMISLEPEISTKDYTLNEASIQVQFTGDKKSDFNSSNNRRLLTKDTSPVDTSYIVADGVRLITAICYENEPDSDHKYFNDTQNDRLHILAAEIDGKTEVYCRQGVGPIFISLPDSNIPVRLIYLTSFPYGGFCEW